VKSSSKQQAAGEVVESGTNASEHCGTNLPLLYHVSPSLVHRYLEQAVENASLAAIGSNLSLKTKTWNSECKINTRFVSIDPKRNLSEAPKPQGIKVGDERRGILL